MTQVLRQLEQIEVQNDRLLLITRPLESPAEATL